MGDSLRASGAGRDDAAAQQRARHVAAVVLERRYRRLLALYPARYRRVHGEEMLAVLLTAAPDGQDRPGLAETADLITGALRIRWQAVLATRLGPRGAAILIGAGAILGLLAGLPFATVTQPPRWASVTVTFAYHAPPAGQQEDGPIRQVTDLATSYPVLAQAARSMRPATTERALQQNVTVDTESWPGGAREYVTVQASTGSAAVRAASAVADSYVRALEHDGRSGSFGGLFRDVQPSVPPAQLGAPGAGSSDAGQTTALGALLGALAGAIAAAAITVRGRRYRTPWGASHG